MERISHEEIGKRTLVAKWASDQRMLSRVYGAAFLLRAARARGRKLRSPRIIPPMEYAARRFNYWGYRNQT